MEPGYDAVMQTIAACGLAAMVELANADSSYLHDVDDRLRLEPIERLRRLGTPRHVDVIERLAEGVVEAIVIGETGAALHGWPLILPGDSDVEVCATAATAAACQALEGVTVLQQAPGTRGYSDLRRDQELIEVPGGQVRVASPLDLLRIERAAATRCRRWASKPCSSTAAAGPTAGRLRARTPSRRRALRLRHG